MKDSEVAEVVQVDSGNMQDVSAFVEGRLRSTWKGGPNNELENNFSPLIDRKVPRHDFESDSEIMTSSDFKDRDSPAPVTLTKAYSPRVHAVIQEARKLFGGRSGLTPMMPELVHLKDKLSALRIEDVAGERLQMLSKGDVGYVSLEDNKDFTIGVFFLAPGARIPLHDHPEMCVLSHIVKGMVHCTSFDFDTSSANNLAYLVDDGMYTAPITRTLFPTSGGNLHSFATKTGCIIVDVMSPPYDEMDGRECTYFKASRVHNFTYKVEKMPPPEDFEVIDLS